MKAKPKLKPLLPIFSGIEIHPTANGFLVAPIMLRESRYPGYDLTYVFHTQAQLAEWIKKQIFAKAPRLMQNECRVTAMGQK